jgi:P-type conjugative transfer protein TrbJ
MHVFLRTIVLLVGLGISLPTLTLAQFGSGVVFDPSNYAVNLMNQVNTLRSTLNEAQMLANQVKALEYQIQSLWNEAQNLKANPLQLAGQIQGMWTAYNSLMANAAGLTYNLDQSRVRFETAYPAVASADMTTITRSSVAMLESIRNASKTAVASQSIYERLCNELAANNQALTAAQASQGALQIAQAQAQIAALSNEQLATMSQIEAANGRVQTEFVAMQVKDRQDGRAVNERWMQGYGTAGFKGIGQGTGVPLR